MIIIQSRPIFQKSTRYEELRNFDDERPPPPRPPTKKWAICNITNIMRYIYFHEVVSDMVLFLNCRPAMKAAHRFDSRGGDDLDLMESSEYVDFSPGIHLFPFHFVFSIILIWKNKWRKLVSSFVSMPFCFFNYLDL